MGERNADFIPGANGYENERGTELGTFAASACLAERKLKRRFVIEYCRMCIVFEWELWGGNVTHAAKHQCGYYDNKNGKIQYNIM